MYTTTSNIDSNTELHNVYFDHNDFDTRAAIVYCRTYIADRLCNIPNTRNVIVHINLYPISNISTTQLINVHFGSDTILWFNASHYSNGISHGINIHIYSSTNNEKINLSTNISIGEKETMNALVRVYDILDALVSYARNCWTEPDDSLFNDVIRLMKHDSILDNTTNCSEDELNSIFNLESSLAEVIDLDKFLMS